MKAHLFRIGSLTAGLALAATAAVVPAAGQLAAGANQSGPTTTPALTATTLVSGSSLDHAFTPAGTTILRTEPLADPDDITRLGSDLFVGFQNGVGPQGQPSADGNTASTIVELSRSGHVLGQWDITGKADGVTADPGHGSVIATVNEDNNSSLYVIHPEAASPITHYQYNEALPHGGGTDAISVFDGKLFISASAPGTTGLPAPQSTDPAVYWVTLDPSDQVAMVTPLFSDEDPATVANVDSPQYGKSTPLALTDPDSNEVVPQGAPRFAGRFLLTSQGDLEQIYVADPGGPDQHLSVLSLSQAVDDTTWATGGWGTLYATDSTHDTVEALTGWFRPGETLVAVTPCGSNSAPATCPAPPAYPANYLGSLNPWTGQIQRLDVDGHAFTPQGGLLFVAGDHDGDQDGD